MLSWIPAENSGTSCSLSCVSAVGDHLIHCCFPGVASHHWLHTLMSPLPKAFYKYSNASSCPFATRIFYWTVYMLIAAFSLWTCLPLYSSSTLRVPHRRIPSPVAIEKNRCQGAFEKLQANILSAEGWSRQQLWPRSLIYISSSISSMQQAAENSTFVKNASNNFKTTIFAQGLKTPYLFSFSHNCTQV